MMRNIAFSAAVVYFFVAIVKVSKADEILTKIPLNMVEPNENMTVLEKWEYFEKSLKGVAKTAVNRVLPFLMENSVKLNLSKECVRNSIHLLSGLKNIKSWAVQFLDSSAKSIDGLLSGTFGSYGSYTECLDTEVKSTKHQDKGKLLFRGQYCLIDIKPPLPPKTKYIKVYSEIEELKNFSQGDTVIAEAAKLAHFSYILPLQIGICTPSGCSKEDINKVVKLLAEPLLMNVSASRCEVKEENKFPPVVIGVITCYSFAGFLMLIGTLTDMYVSYRKVNLKSKFFRVLMCFSFISNFKKFVNTETRSDTLTCLNGIRFLTMTWVIIGHTYLLINHNMVDGFMKALTMTTDFAFQPLMNGSLAVDTFFFIGGLLVSFLSVKLVCNQGQKINIWMYIIHRLWRIYPVYVFVIMFYFLMNLIGSGPFWHYHNDKFLNACHENWWTNLLFINNFYDARDMCIAHSWYLASDSQMYVAALLIIIPLTRRPKLGISLAVLAILASIIYVGTVVYVYDLPPTLLATIPDEDEFYDLVTRIYFKPFMHVSPYCIGLLAGYLLATKPDLKIPPFIQVMGWCFAFIINFSVIYGVYEWNKGLQPTILSSILYSSLHRTGWALGIAWMIICCATGHGGIINYILSWEAFVPLGRLTYVAYLTHPLVQVAAIGSVRTTLQADHFLAVWFFFGNLCVTYGVAFAGTMLIESPFLAMEKILFPRADKKAEDNPLVIENNILNGHLKSDKNGDIAVIAPAAEVSARVDNKCVVYKL